VIRILTWQLLPSTACINPPPGSRFQPPIMDTLHHYLFHGNLRQGGSWGGAVCAAYLPFQELM
jgi:hypothetical protein